MAGKWSAEQTSELVELYQGEPILYTISDPNYHNKFKRQTALEGIVECLKDVRPNSKVNEIKAKINSLRARFSSELAKLRNKPSGSGLEGCISFPYMEKMLFLQDHIVARKGFCSAVVLDAPLTSGVIEDDEDILQLSSGTENNMEEHESESPTLMETSMPTLLPATREVRSRKRKRKENSEVEDNFLLQASSTLQLLGSKTDQPQRDAWDDFGKYVASSLRALKNNQMKCKHELQNVIMKFEEENNM